VDARTAAHTLSQIAAFLELRGENRFKAGAYERAARAVLALGADDLRPLLESGALAATPGIGPATLSVLEDLVRTGESPYLERLQAEMPEGLLDLMRIPGLGVAKVRKIHEALGITTVDELEAAARDGRIAVLTALESPFLTILAHPTGRLLLTREPYAIDLAAVFARAAANGVAVELNADPHRLDLDWRHVRAALTRGITIEIGPDAHSTRGLDHMSYGVGMARKGWTTAGDVLNARPVEDVLEFARKRRK